MVQQHNRRLLADRPMWAFFVVVLAPILQFFLGVCKAHEPMSIQTFRSEAAVKCLDEARYPLERKVQRKLSNAVAGFAAG